MESMTLKENTHGCLWGTRSGFQTAAEQALWVWNDKQSIGLQP